MRHPIDVLSNVIRKVDGNHKLGAAMVAEAIVENITDPDLVENAVNALLASVYGEDHTPDYWRAIARTVLLSLGEAHDRPEEG
jgi:hypothetical protein